jgi:phosphotransferase system enzyme I (PtsP)
LLAVDRNNNRVSNLFDALHPAVLKALIQVVEGAHREGKTVSICGEMAGDPAAVILLLAMGFDMLSVSAPILPRIKWVIRKFSMSRARKLLSEVLLMGSSAEIRRHLEFALEEEGLGGLIRAGRH